MEKGKIIFLNGVSSAGKSTLARRLQQQSPEPYYCIAQDTFTSAVAPCYKGKFCGEKLNDLWLDAVRAMHHTIKLYSDLGYNVVVDHVLTRYTDEDGRSDRSLEECAELLRGHHAWLVKVECPIEELRRREVARGDRAPGSAEWQLQYLVPQKAYDVYVNTAVNPAEACAETILEYVGSHAPMAFDAVRAAMNSMDSGI